MQTIVDNWAAILIKGILWDDADEESIPRVTMNTWDPDDVMFGSPMLLDSRNIYLLESYLISNGNYKNLMTWKRKADTFLSYSNSFGISMASLSTCSTPILSSYDSTPQLNQARFDTAIYNFHYF
ncbi:unnamed protein product [Rotaria sp. Silwood2]|nr:unnamed protein product [Rotaria sp. Silwood2]CAF4132360.1 unnamed protein product [Rotaria sp. Silwood2]